MNNIKLNVLIGSVTFVLCLIITITSSINFFWLIVPIFFIILVVYLASLLRQRFGTSYGIPAYLIVLFVIPILWYLFSANMPFTSKMIASQQKAEDFSSFQNYAGSVDAKQEVANYQMKQDSILKEQVSKLLQENKVDSALSLIKHHDKSSDRIKNELFNTITQTNQTNTENVPHQETTSKKTTFGKLAVIEDPDGYSNVRSAQGKQYNILGIIRTGEQFYARSDTRNDWWQVKTQNGLIGYVHKSRIRFIQ